MGALPMLVFGSIGTEERRSMQVAAKAANLDLRVAETIDEAIKILDREKLRAVLVEVDTEGAERLCIKARGKQNFTNVPIIAVGEELSDLAFAKVFRWGADDLVPLRGAAEVVRRLAVLPEPTTLPPPKARGEALVADADHARCDVIGRVLTNVGYEVRYAIDERSAEYYLTRTSMRLVVASAEVIPPKKKIPKARAAGNDSIWIVTSRPRDMERHARELAGFDRVATTNAFAPPENLVFLANELARGDIADGRRQRRLLFGTLVHFREEGQEGDDHGLTYNISEHGLYVRTLVVPDAKRLWI